MKAVKDNDRILDEIRIRSDSYVSGTGLTQPFLEAEDKPKSQDWSLLLWVAPPFLPCPHGDESLLISIGWSPG